MAMRLSVVLITFNEASRVQRCLDSVRWADEIVVVDSGSTDQTLDHARPFAARTFTRPFDDFASQKNHAVAQASHDWIFSIDADEVMTEALRKEIEALLAGAPVQDRYSVPRENIYFGRSVRHVLGRDEPVRLFKKSVCRFEGLVHEKVVGGSLGQLKSPLLHHSCATYPEWVAKHRTYVRMEAQKRFAEGRRFSWAHCLLSPAKVFLFRFFGLQGWKDGLAGWRVALEMAGSTVRMEKELRRCARRAGGSA